MDPKYTLELSTSSGREILVSWFGVVPYEVSHQLMMDFAAQRDADAMDELWLLEHPRVYTQGTACELATFVPSDIRLVKTDRGGQITYHGPGQVVMYPLLHLKNHNIGVKSLVSNLEQTAIDYLKSVNIESVRKQDAPGVYVDGAKIAALGLRIKRSNSYHGLSLNVDMDLSPFTNIDPCGYQGLEVTQLADLGVMKETEEVGKKLAQIFVSSI